MLPNIYNILFNIIILNIMYYINTLWIEFHQNYHDIEKPQLHKK